MKKFYPLIGIAATCWVVFIINLIFLGNRLNHFGIVPRHLTGLWHIPVAPFLHADLHHIVSNTVPLLILGGIISLESRARFIAVTLGGIVLGGFLTWCIGRNACHIGASGLIFCYFGYIIASAIFQRTLGSILIATITFFFYGGILWGLCPQEIVSWEGHAAGLITGIFIAWSEKNLSSTKLDRAA
jgi:membrane associated rhomboid family serine protease